MSQVIVVTSGKGGVGKTTTAAALAWALARQEKSVCLVDFDIGLRNLDMTTGLERRVVFDIVDVIRGKASLSQALVQDEGLAGVSLLGAAQCHDKAALTLTGVSKVIAGLSTMFDYVICDSPAGIEVGALHACYYADSAIVVVNQEATAVRDADRMIGILQAKTRIARSGGHMPVAAVVTRYKQSLVERGLVMTSEQLANILDVEVIGRVPETEEVIAAGNRGGMLALSPDSELGRAYLGVATHYTREQSPAPARRDRRRPTRAGFFSRRFGRTSSPGA